MHKKLSLQLLHQPKSLQWHYLFSVLVQPRTKENNFVGSDLLFLTPSCLFFKNLVWYAPTYEWTHRVSRLSSPVKRVRGHTNLSQRGLCFLRTITKCNSWAFLSTSSVALSNCSQFPCLGLTDIRWIFDKCWLRPRARFWFFVLIVGIQFAYCVSYPILEKSQLKEIGLWPMMSFWIRRFYTGSDDLKIWLLSVLFHYLFTDRSNVWTVSFAGTFAIHQICNQIRQNLWWQSFGHCHSYVCETFFIRVCTHRTHGWKIHIFHPCVCTEFTHQIHDSLVNTSRSYTQENRATLLGYMSSTNESYSGFRS